MLKIRNTIFILIKNSLIALKKSKKFLIYESYFDEIFINIPLKKEYGDFSTNIALRLSKKIGISSNNLAHIICNNIDKNNLINFIKVIKPGFINFYIHKNNHFKIIKNLVEKKTWRHKKNIKEKWHIEFVSANPTGPLHVGHGRSAAYGSALANILCEYGKSVYTEYYINDSGRQIDILTISVWLRYIELHGIKFDFPKNIYQGFYIKEIAKKINEKIKNIPIFSQKEIFNNLNKQDMIDNQELYIDKLIFNIKYLLKFDIYKYIYEYSLKWILKDIKNDLSEFSVTYNLWFSEKNLIKKNEIQKAIELLKKKKYIYKKEGATWFHSKKFGDDKDRVLIRENGQTTYFASDAAYILNKISRGFNRLILILGADHHGYMLRIQALMQAFGLNNQNLKIPIVQFVRIVKNDKLTQMSTRSGFFITFRQFRKKIGNDIARFFYLTHKVDQHIDFDINFIKSQNNENSLYYIQYAYARICSVFKMQKNKKLKFNSINGLKSLHLLKGSYENCLINLLNKYPYVLEKSAHTLQPHLFILYLKDIAKAVHSYYNSQKILVEDIFMRNARLCLLFSIKIILKKSLYLLGISSPKKM